MSDDATSLVAQLIEGLDPGAFVTRFVLVAEVIDSQGDRGMWMETQDAARWDIYALLTWALEEERANHQLSTLLADDEDD